GKSGSEVSSNGRNIRTPIPLELSTVDAGRDLYLRRIAKRSAAYRIDRTVRRPPRLPRPAGAFRGTDASGAALPAAAGRSSAEFGARHDGRRPGILDREPRASPSAARRDERSGRAGRDDAQLSETARPQASPVGTAHVPQPEWKSHGALVEGASLPGRWRVGRRADESDVRLSRGTGGHTPAAGAVGAGAAVEPRSAVRGGGARSDSKRSQLDDQHGRRSGRGSGVGGGARAAAGGGGAADDRAGDAENSGDAVERDAGYAGTDRGMDESTVRGISRDQIGVRRIGQ